MSYPAGVLVSTITFDNVLSVLGVAADATVTVQPDFGGTPYLIWAATGARLLSDAESVAISGAAPTLQLAQVDQVGWTDAQGRPITGWAYIAVVTYTTGDGSRVTEQVRFQLIAGQTSVDFGALMRVQFSSPTTSLAPTVSSVGGLTGVISQAELLQLVQGSGPVNVPFTNQSNLAYTHGLGRVPSVQFRDSSGTPFFTDNHADATTVTATFPTPTTGLMVLS